MPDLAEMLELTRWLKFSLQNFQFLLLQVLKRIKSQNLSVEDYTFKFLHDRKRWHNTFFASSFNLPIGFWKMSNYYFSQWCDLRVVDDNFHSSFAFNSCEIQSEFQIQTVVFESNMLFRVTEIIIRTNNS